MNSTSLKIITWTHVKCMLKIKYLKSNRLRSIVLAPRVSILVYPLFFRMFGLMDHLFLGWTPSFQAEKKGGGLRDPMKKEMDLIL